MSPTPVNCSRQPDNSVADISARFPCPNIFWRVTSMIKIICTDCGSDDIVADAYARWNTQTQEVPLK